MMLLRSSSKRKRQDLAEFDIISDLPDSVLSHILSFLPTTERAVRTSILSKRWRYVWTLVDKLVFDGRFNGRLLFAPFVYRVLELHQGNIKELTLSWIGYGCIEGDVTRWIDTAISRGVVKLDVSADFNYKCPLCFFTCKTLVDLKISILDSSYLEVPVAPFFPALKKLHVKQLSCDTESFKRIISQCLALEHLIVFTHTTPFDIVSSSMKRLELNSPPLGFFDEKIILRVPSLEYLRINFILPYEFIVEEKLSSLVEADICFRDTTFLRYVAVKPLREAFVRFIQLLTNVKVLRLECRFENFLNSVGHGQFLNLTKFEIISPFFEWRLLVSLMETSNNLETICLKKTSKLKKHKLSWREPKYVPTCLSSSLKKLYIDGYSEDELPMVKYVLRTAQILERMDIHCADSYKENKLTSDMLQNIEKLHRACDRCEIFMSDKIIWNFPE